MRITVLLFMMAGFTANLYSAPQVIMTDSLRASVAGRIVQKRLAGYVGKRGSFRQHYTATITRMIVPEVSSRGDHSQLRFRAVLGDVEKDGVAQEEMNDMLIELKELDIFGMFNVGHVQLLDSEMLGKDYDIGRLLAKYQGEDGKTYWEVLIELVRIKELISPPRYHRQPLESPFVVTLSEQEDFMEFRPLPNN